MNGCAFINVELTSRCHKNCWCCGRRKIEKEFPSLADWGDMPYEMVKEIAKQVPKGIVIQLHNNGEPLLYPQLGDALRLFSGCIRSFNTNAKLLLERSREIIGNLESLVISVVQDDPEQEEQYDTVVKFIERKGAGKPLLVYRLLGDVDKKERWAKLPGVNARRILHRPEGSFGYSKKVTVPEIGVCLDLLTHLAIDRYGHISLCVRFDPQGYLRIGHISQGIEKAWNSEKRKFYINHHIMGMRKKLPGCDVCEYWGVPTGWV